MRGNPDPSISVVVVCERRPELLTDCLQSVLGQSTQASEIIVIDDATGGRAALDAQRFAKPFRVIALEGRDSRAARLRGLTEAQGDLVCFLEPQDMLSPGYLGAALAAFKEDYRNAIVYSDLEHPEYLSARTVLPNEVTPALLSRYNVIPASAVVCRDAALRTKAFEPPHPTACDASWLAWRRILAAGYRAVRQPGVCIRRHVGSAPSGSYFESRALSLETVTIFLAISGDPRCWREQRAFLSRQTWPRSQSVLAVCYTGSDTQFLAEARRDLEALSYCDCIVTSLESPVHADDPCARVRREHLLASTAASVADSPLVLLLDEHLIPPEDIIQRLLGSFSAETVSVAADHPTPPGVRSAILPHVGRSDEDDLVRVAATSFCCVLVRSDVLKEVFLVPNDAEQPVSSPESVFYASLAPEQSAWMLSSAYCRAIVPLNELFEPVRADSQAQFDETFYCATNPDVTEAIRTGALSSGYEHWLRFGRKEGRPAHFY